MRERNSPVARRGMCSAKANLINANESLISPNTRPLSIMQNAVQQAWSSIKRCSAACALLVIAVSCLVSCMLDSAVCEHGIVSASAGHNAGTSERERVERNIVVSVVACSMLTTFFMSRAFRARSLTSGRKTVSLCCLRWSPHHYKGQ